MSVQCRRVDRALLHRVSEMAMTPSDPIGVNIPPRPRFATSSDAQPDKENSVFATISEREVHVRSRHMKYPLRDTHSHLLQTTAQEHFRMGARCYHRRLNGSSVNATLPQSYQRRECIIEICFFLHHLLQGLVCGVSTEIGAQTVHDSGV